MPKPGDIENGVLVGHNGYLFLAGGAHDVLAMVTGRKPIPGESIRIFRENLEARNRWAEEHKIAYVHLIVPDKQSVIPEEWPFDPPIRLGQVFADGSEGVAKMFYPTDLLQKHKEKAIKKADTHLSDHGSLLLAVQLVESFVGESQKAAAQHLDSRATIDIETNGDLGAKLDPPLPSTERKFGERPPGTWYHNDLKGGNNGIVDIRINPAAPMTRTCLMFGDSFGRDICTQLQHWFVVVLFFRTPFFHPDIVAQACPDFVVTQTIERYLPSTRTDEERPLFFAYPHINGLPYSPSREFSNALSCILSYPRPPYWAFMEALNGKSRR